MKLHLFFRNPFRFSESKFYATLTFLLIILTTTTNSLIGQTLIGPSELLANTESSYYLSDPSVTGNWEVNGSATVSSSLVNQNAIKVKANNLCVGRFTVIVKIGDKYLFRQVDIIKNLPPIFTSGATTATLSCNSTLEDFNKYKPTAKDIDGNPVEVVMIDMMPMQMGKCQSVVTWQATDKCGNKAIFKQTIEIVGNTVDTEAPVFDQTTLVKTFYDCDKLPNTFPVPKATDNCVNPVMVKLVRREVSERIRSSIACMSYFEILTWEATDVCGNKRQADQTICVVDNVPPVFVSSTLAPITVFQCGFDYDKYQPKATDNCSNPVMIMAVDIQTTIIDAGRRTVIITWEATDMCGNATRAMQRFNVIDQTPPRINRGLPLPNIAIECNDNLNNIQIPSGFDDCGDPVEVILASRRAIVAGNCNGIVEVTWKATDASGNMSFAKQIVNINDKTPPVITCPTPMTVSCASEVPAPNIAAVVATDNCDLDVAVAFVNDVISNQTCANRYTITRTYKGTDDCGNATNCTQIITVNDRTVPIITCPAAVEVSCANLVPAPNIALVTASDNCGGNVGIDFVNDAISNRICANRYTITRTYIATDECGNTATCTQTITVNDQTPPTITCPGTITVSCANLVPAPNTTLPTASDNCGGNVVISHVGDAAVGGQCANRFRITRTYMATDLCGNTATCTQTIIVDDQTPPTFTFCPPGANLGCNPRVIPAAGNATATDVCGAVTITDALGNITTNGCNRSQTRTYTATDACGNTSTCVQVFTWTVDVAGPTFTFCPPGANLGCNPRIIPAAGVATATDACGGVTITDALGTITTDGCLRSQTRTYTATDVCGNTSTCTQVFTWTLDVTPPVFTFCPPGSNLGCNPTGVPAPGAATATDACGAVTITSALGNITPNGCQRTQTRTYTATDACGNTATCAQVFIWTVDAVGPTFTFCPPGANLGCNPRIIPAAGIAIATDACGAVTITDALGNITTNGCSRSQTRTYTATDACGNISTCTQVFTWTMDNGNPTFTFCPPGSNLGCNPNGVPAPGAATATDDCGAPVITSALGPITADGCLRSQTRTYTATDICGNTATCAQVFTWTLDVTPPVFTFCPPGSNLGCNPTGVPPPGTATATDACGAPGITSALGPITPNGCQRTQTRTYTATDACGNTATCAQVFTWTVDAVGPTFTFCPPGANLGCNPNGVPAPGAATATDACGAVTITSALGNITTNGCSRSQTRTYTATDACGNTATCLQVFTWTVDVIPPLFTFCPPGSNLGCNPNGVPAPGAATATDDCGAPVITSALGPITADGCFRSQTRTYTATDICGNTSTCTQVFTWTLDVTPPVFTFCPPGSNLGCNPAGVPAPGAATATDACGAPGITSALGNITPNGCQRSQTRTYTATDACGNTATCLQVFTWTVDVAGPTFTFCPPGANLGCNPNGVPAPGAATATDACGAVTITSALGNITTNGCSRSQTRTYTATDACGNTSICTQEFTWTEDRVPPVLTCPTVNGAATCPGGNATFGIATATDNCGQMVTITFTDVTTGMGCNISTTRTWIATDACGNTSTCSRSITSQDLVPPSFNNTCPANRTVPCVNPPAVPAFGPAPTATDNCDRDVTVTFVDVPVTGTTCGRIFMRTWTARDDCGNTATCSQTITETPSVQFFQNGTPILNPNNLTVIEFTPVLNISQTDPCCVGDFFTSINITVSVCGGAPISLGVNNAQVCLERNGNSVNYKLAGLTITFTACATVYTLMGTKTNGVIQGKNCTVRNMVVCPAGQGFYDANGVPICDAVGGNNCTFCSTPPPPPIAPQSNLDVVAPQWKDKTHQHVSKEMTLSAFPNPTTGDINFSITTPTKGNLRLKLFDASGRQIGLIQRDDLEAGFENQIKYNIPAAVPNGLIFYTVTVGEEVKSGKLMYMKN